MPFYSHYIFPLVVDFALNRPKIGKLRSELLSEAKGKILEIGFGTGLNLPFYPPFVKEITVVEPNLGMGRKAQKRVKKSGMDVELFSLKGESLPFSNEGFDTVVSTFTLCSIGGLAQALDEIRRVLKRHGRFLILEHGLSPEPSVSRWQQRLTPLQKIVGDGCHLNRDMEKILKETGFEFISLNKFYGEGFPRFVGYFYQGIAQKIL